jgi:hypothetical protein
MRFELTTAGSGVSMKVVPVPALYIIERKTSWAGLVVQAVAREADPRLRGNIVDD